MTDQDWDDTESEEEEEARLEDWLANSRAVWYIILEQRGRAPEIGEADTEEKPLFAGIWEIHSDWDEATGQMTLAGLPDFPMELPVRTEVHRIPRNDRPDKYQPEKYRDHAFEHVLVIRPVEKPLERRQEGERTIISLDQEDKINYLRLSGRIGDF